MCVYKIDRSHTVPHSVSPRAPARATQRRRAERADLGPHTHGKPQARPWRARWREGRSGPARPIVLLLALAFLRRQVLRVALLAQRAAQPPAALVARPHNIAQALDLAVEEVVPACPAPVRVHNVRLAGDVGVPLLSVGNPVAPVSLLSEKHGAGPLPRVSKGQKARPPLANRGGMLLLEARPLDPPHVAAVAARGGSAAFVEPLPMAVAAAIARER
mmetsp:Transcript_30998/g.99118  ORF Transcript_30998/g.99118 Transcript_30998/m.99118 type:complete len:217 (-) Transcript_30998:59-709(-)